MEKTPKLEFMKKILSQTFHPSHVSFAPKEVEKGSHHVETEQHQPKSEWSLLRKGTGQPVFVHESGQKIVSGQGPAPGMGLQPLSSQEFAQHFEHHSGVVDTLHQQLEECKTRLYDSIMNEKRLMHDLAIREQKLKDLQQVHSHKTNDSELEKAIATLEVKRMQTGLEESKSGRETQKERIEQLMLNCRSTIVKLQTLLDGQLAWMERELNNDVPSLESTSSDRAHATMIAFKKKHEDMIERMSVRLNALRIDLQTIEPKSQVEYEMVQEHKSNEEMSQEDLEEQEEKQKDTTEEQQVKPIDEEPKQIEAPDPGDDTKQIQIKAQDKIENKTQLQPQQALTLVKDRVPPGYYRTKTGNLVKEIPRNEDNELVFPHQIQLPRFHAAALKRDGTKYNALFATLYGFIERLHGAVQTRMGTNKRDRLGESLRVRIQPPLATYWRMDPKDPQLDCTVSIEANTFTRDVERYVTPTVFQALLDVMSVIKRHARGVRAMDNATLYDFICSFSLSVPFTRLVVNVLTSNRKRNTTRIDAARSAAQEVMDIQTFVQSGYVKKSNKPLEFHQIV